MSTIKGQIELIITLCTVFIIAVICIINGISTKNIMESNEKELLKKTAVITSHVINGWLEEQADIVHTIRNGLAYMNSKDTEAIMDYLELNLAENENALMYYCCFSYDKGVFPADHSTLDLNPTERDWWKQAIAENGLIFTAPYTDYATGQMIVSIAEVSRDLEGKAEEFSASIQNINGIINQITRAQTELSEAMGSVNDNLQEITNSGERVSGETSGILERVGILQGIVNKFRM